MRSSRAVGLACFGVWLSAALAGCGNKDSGSTASQGSGGSNGNGGGPDLGTLPSDSAGSSAMGGGCAGKRVDAKRLPLDMYVMLDVSGSMLEQTEGDASVNKWHAVTSALTDFVKDPASAGISVGLQVFPLRHPDAPATCSSDAQCSPNFGKCLTKICWAFTANAGPCQSDADCGDNEGDCIAFGLCENDDTFVCRNPGGECGTDADTGKALGACVANVPVCLGSGDCRAADYATTAVPMSELPGAQSTVLAALQALEPDRNGLTPTGPALAGALSLATTWAQAHVDHQVITLLATDGIPTLKGEQGMCQDVGSQADLDAIAQLASSAKMAKPSISTFVIGVLGPNDTNATATLQAIATSGGSGKAFIVDTRGNVQTQFRQALDQIRGGLSCDLAVPEGEPGQPVEYDKNVNVEFSRTGTVESLLYVETAAGCTDHPRGWYYDVDPKTTKPSRILTCPAVCTDFQATTVGSVDIRLGCQTIKPK